MDTINKEQMEEIGLKIQNGTASKEEVIIFLKGVNVLLEDIKKDITSSTN